MNMSLQAHSGEKTGSRECYARVWACGEARLAVVRWTALRPHQGEGPMTSEQGFHVLEQETHQYEYFRQNDWPDSFLQKSRIP